LLSPDEIQTLADVAIAHGGRASFKNNADGSRSVYELNVSYFDALSDPAADEPLEVQVARFIASQAIMLSLVGVPGIYVHSLFGSRNWQEGVAQTGRNRTINRQKLDRAALEAELADPGSLRHQVYSAYTALLRARAAEPAFHPYGEQRVLPLDPAVFSLLRYAPGTDERVLCLHNVSGETRRVDVTIGVNDRPGLWRDLMSGEVHTFGAWKAMVDLAPYGVCWLKGESSGR
jgi:sucrose phosphorylase